MGATDHHHRMGATYHFMNLGLACLAVLVSSLSKSVAGFRILESSSRTHQSFNFPRFYSLAPIHNHNTGISLGKARVLLSHKYRRGYRMNQEDLWRSFPTTATAFEAMFPDEEACRRYLV